MNRRRLRRREQPERNARDPQRRTVVARRLTGERGAAAVEMALVLSLLVLLVFGIAQIAIAYNRAQGLHAAAREGARVGSIPTVTESEIKDRVYAALEGVIPDPATNATVVVTPSGSPPCNLKVGQPLTVKVTINHTIDIPLWGTVDRTLTGKSEFRCE